MRLGCRGRVGLELRLGLWPGLWHRGRAGCLGCIPLSILLGGRHLALLHLQGTKVVNFNTYAYMMS